MNKQIQQTREFNSYILDLPTKPTINRDAIFVRIALLKEEIQELKEATMAGDMTEIRDAITDIRYVLYGIFNSCGLDEIADNDFDKVHSSNMLKVLDSKEEAEIHAKKYNDLGVECEAKEKNGKYAVFRYDGKLMKPTNWQKHDFETINL
jgi:predicted HAD superfamily Cof-like phosphohydrolase